MSRWVVSICLALIIVSPSYAIVIDEDRVITPTGPGLAIGLQYNNLYPHLSLLSQPDAKLEMDVAWIASEWSGNNIWAKWDSLAINGVPGWAEFSVIDTVNPSYPGTWDPYSWGEVHNRTIAYDITGYNWAGVEGSFWLQFNIGLNLGGDSGFSWGNFYVNEVRIVPEPATIALLGLGGLALIRRKR